MEAVYTLLSLVEGAFGALLWLSLLVMALVALLLRRMRLALMSFLLSLTCVALNGFVAELFTCQGNGSTDSECLCVAMSQGAMPWLWVMGVFVSGAHMLRKQFRLALLAGLPLVVILVSNRVITVCRWSLLFNCVLMTTVAFSAYRFFSKKSRG